MYQHDIPRKYFSSVFDLEDNFSVIVVGSRTEGIVPGMDSDFDVLVVDNDIICTEYLDKLTNISRYKRIFQLDMTNAPPGYCYLKTTEGCSYTEEIPPWVDGDYTRTGPAFQPARYMKELKGLYSVVKSFFHVPDTLLSVSYDFVAAYKCNLPVILAAWCVRERRYDWPSRETIQHVSTLPVHVVQVGLKGHEKEELQWRISFTLAEIHLIQTLNNSHIKVYVCLKKITKQYLNPICKSLTSYVIKNIILWMAEFQPNDNFKSEFLNIKALSFT